ncbi:MAG: hypothetical protein ACRDRR_25215 [Pseudonocardiaceae bacterium]
MWITVLVGCPPAWTIPVQVVGSTAPLPTGLPAASRIATPQLHALLQRVGRVVGVHAAAQQPVPAAPVAGTVVTVLPAVGPGASARTTVVCTNGEWSRLRTRW